MESEEIAKLSCDESFGGGHYSVALHRPHGEGHGPPSETAWVLHCVRRDLANSNEWQRTIGAGYADHLLRGLAETKVSAIPAYAEGCDGADYELLLRQGRNHVTYQWWGGTPKGYEALVSFCNELLAAGAFSERVAIMDWEG